MSARSAMRISMMAAAVRILVGQVLAQPGHEVVAIGQSGQRVAVGFAAHGFQACGFFLEHGLQATDRGVHGGGQLAQFRHLGLVDGDEASLGDRLWPGR